jgi:hypothetical protein
MPPEQTSGNYTDCKKRCMDGRLSHQRFFPSGPVIGCTPLASVVGAFGAVLKLMTGPGRQLQS